MYEIVVKKHKATMVKLPSEEELVKMLKEAYQICLTPPNVPIMENIAHELREQLKEQGK